MLLISSFNEAKALGIYSDDWESYSLCEAINVHFINGNTSPIILIANANYEENGTTTEATITLTKSGTSYVGSLSDSKALIDKMAIAISSSSGSVSEDNISISYEGDKVKVVVSGTDVTSTSVTATYNTVTGEKLSTTVFSEALKLLDSVENITVRIPNILCAPNYSNDPQYHDLMVQKAIEKIASKWNLICASDIAGTDITSNSVAISWKNTNAYNNVLDKVFYPMVAYNGKTYHLSVIATAKMQELDIDSGDIPYVSPSNKPIFVDSLVDASGNTVYQAESEANTLNQNGITTAISMKGQIRLWGSHMANYNYDKLSDIANEDRFDVAVRMAVYMKNYLQYNYLDEIDNTITKKDVDGIINSVQMWLDSLVNAGMLLFATVELDGDSDVANGDLAFNIHVTYPFIVKSITFKIIYTDEGLSILTSSEEGGVE